jgi:hypothetical protein
MKMEEHFKETLNRAVANEPPVLDAWDRFERRVGRSRRWRLFAGLAGTAAVIVAAAIVVPQLGTSGVKPGPFATQPSTVIPTDLGNPFPIDDWNTFKSADGYEVRYPRWWVVSEFEAVWEFRPYWLKGEAVGEPTYSVTFRVDPVPMAEAKANPTWPKDATFFELDANRTLVAVVLNTDPDLAQRYGWIGRRIMLSVLQGTFGGPGAPAPESIKHVGTVADGIDSDARLDALVGFMDARLQGTTHGAEDYLTAVAKQVYMDRLNLYDWEPPGLVYYEYRILSRDDADANSSEFVIEIVVANASGTGMTAPSFRERILVGAGVNYLGEQREAVIRSAMGE